MHPNEQFQMLRSAQLELQEVERRAAYLRQVIDGLQGLLYPRTETGSISMRPVAQSLAQTGQTVHELTHHTGIDSLSARDAVATIMHRNPNRGLTSRQIYAMVIDYGLQNPEFVSGHAAYDTALRRLAAEPGSFVSRDEATATFIYRPDDVWYQSDDSWSNVRGQMHNAELDAFEAQHGRDHTIHGGHT